MDSWVTLALPGAVAYATSLLNDRAAGEDIVQDCICRLLDRAARYDLASDGRKLLFAAITNACINFRTRQRKHLSLHDGRAGGDGRAWHISDASASAPPELAMAEELRVAIADGLAALPVRYRSAIELAGLGHGTQDIAEMLEVEPQNARVILFRARKAMARFLNEKFPGGVSP